MDTGLARVERERRVPQWLDHRRGRKNRFLIAMLAAAGCSSPALSAAKVTYGVSVEETITDNVALASSANAESDLISRVSPSLRVSSGGGRLSGSAGLSANAVSYASDSSRNTTYLLFDGTGRFDAVPKVLDVSFGGSIRRQYQSSLGRNSIDDALDVGDRSEVRSMFVAPSARFLLGSEIRGTAQLRQSISDDNGDLLGTSRASVGTVSLENPTAYGPFGWGLTASYQRLGVRGDSPATNSRTIRGTVSYRARPNVILRANLGRESNDFVRGDRTGNTIRGVGLDWTLSKRTRFSSTVEKRFFGTGYNYLLSYGRPHSSLSASYGRDVTTAEEAGLPVTLADLAFRDLFSSLESSIPDPIERTRIARELAASIPNGNAAIAGSLTRSTLVSRSIRLTAALIGVRNTLSVSLNRSDSQRLGSAAGLSAGDDFSRFDAIVSKSASVSLTHRISQRSSVSGTLVTSRSDGQGAENEGVRRNSGTVTYSARIGRRTGGALSYRYQKSDGNQGFRENALVGSLNMQF